MGYFDLYALLDLKPVKRFECGSDVWIFESGGSSVVTRWTVDQEVVGSNSTHGWNLIAVVRSLSGFTQPIR